MAGLTRNRQGRRGLGLDVSFDAGCLAIAENLVLSITFGDQERLQWLTHKIARDAFWNEWKSVRERQQQIEERLVSDGYDAKTFDEWREVTNDLRKLDINNNPLAGKNESEAAQVRNVVEGAVRRHFYMHYLRSGEM